MNSCAQLWKGKEMICFGMARKSIARRSIALIRHGTAQKRSQGSGNAMEKQSYAVRRQTNDYQDAHYQP